MEALVYNSDIQIIVLKTTEVAISIVSAFGKLFESLVTNFQISFYQIEMVL